MRQVLGFHITAIAARLVLFCALGVVWLASADLQVAVAVVVLFTGLALTSWLWDGRTDARERYDVRLRTSRQI
jgi:hypothetical protein